MARGSSVKPQTTKNVRPLLSTSFKLTLCYRICGSLARQRLLLINPLRTIYLKMILKCRNPGSQQVFYHLLPYFRAACGTLHEKPVNAPRRQEVGFLWGLHWAAHCDCTGLENYTFLTLKTHLREHCVFGRKHTRDFAGFSNAAILAVSQPSRG